MNLDQLIKESRAKELERQQQDERLRTEEGLKRQQSILEHEEDITEMMEFMHKAGLSKTTARRVATDAVLKKISTAKKLAKIWSRGQLQLVDFGLDKDDLEDLETALTKLLQGLSTSLLSYSVWYKPFITQTPSRKQFLPSQSSPSPPNLTSLCRKATLLIRFIYLLLP